MSVRFPSVSGGSGFDSGFDDESVDRKSANLVYVALTRAMDHLNVFTLTASECQAFYNLEAVFRT